MSAGECRSPPERVAGRQRGRTSGGRNGCGGEKMKGERPPEKRGLTNGVRQKQKGTKGLAVLWPCGYFSADQSSNILGLTKLYSCGRLRNPVE